ncbi:MAG: hypothetical protein MUE60_12800 [Candidatus Eisenbacteria bacterium]|jgi:hypothetical protein|nr:hypothetical protein [Candidatus Eisenbacteria bacterium]
MKRTTALKVLNPILAVVVANQIVTGLAQGLIPYETYEVLHGGGGIIATAVIVLHVVLNWNWVKATYLRKARPAKA